MQTEPFRVPLDIEKLVSNAIWEFRKETDIEVEAEVDRVLIETGLKDRAHLEEEYNQQKVTADDISVAIKELLSRAMRMQAERGRATISDAIIKEVMKMRCPVRPWC